jgi:hypothetical protein
MISCPAEKCQYGIFEFSAIVSLASVKSSFGSNLITYNTLPVFSESEF